MDERFLTAGPFRPAADYNNLLKDDGDWILPGLLPTDGLVVLASAPKTGKTCLATAVARSVATGVPFAGRTPHKSGPVLWCAHEEGPRERRLLHHGLSVTDPLLVAYGDDLPALEDRPESSQDAYGRPLPQAEPYVFEHAVKVGAVLIVVDCLHAAVSKGSLADNAVARRIVGRLKRLAGCYHVGVLLLHHLTKSGSRGHDADRFADSAQILASADAHFFLERTTGTAGCPTGGSSTEDDHTPDEATPGSADFPVGRRSTEHENGTFEASPPPLRSGGGEGVGASATHPTPEPMTESRIILYGRGRYPSPPARQEFLSSGVLDYREAEPENKPPSDAHRIRTLHTERPDLQPAEIAQKLDLPPGLVRVVLHCLNKTLQPADLSGEV